MNLATNARDAMPHGGRLPLAQHARRWINPLFEIMVWKAGMFALISVSDTRIGMSKETTTKIFEPFLRRKDGKVQSWACNGICIIKQHEGTSTSIASG